MCKEGIHVDPLRRLDVGVLLFCWRSRKLPVVLCKELEQNLVDAVNAGDVEESQLTGQSILQGVPRTFDALIRRGRS